MLSPDPDRDLEIIIQGEHGTEGGNEVSTSLLPLPFIDQKALRMMQKMGYKTGAGLGKNEQGITKAVELDIQLGTRGLGLNITGLNLSDEDWDFSKEEIIVEEKVKWLKCSDDSIQISKSWLKEGAPNFNIIGDASFCDKDVLENVFKAKDIFDELNILELCAARAKANPFETVRSVFFMNRAALKMANIDAATDFMFTNVDRNPHFCESKGPFYFADVCAGPGGFTEYVLWRKKWSFKGFGLTLKDEHDFKVTESMCASPATFQALYGRSGDGDVCDPDNIHDFTERVLNETKGKGVHFMMSDGGFSVEGNEDIQEILSKSIYVCQCLVALEVVRTNGHFVTKIFDVFTPFSVGLLFLIYKCFDKISILKPNSSRPANSERYFICQNKKSQSKIQPIKEYLWKIVNCLWEIKNDAEVDIMEIVPFDVIKNEKKFLDYIYESNTRIGKNQIIALEKLAAFCRNPNLTDVRQEELRKKCLEYWDIPDKPRRPNESYKIDSFLTFVDLAPEILKVRPRSIFTMSELESTLTDVTDWRYVPMCSTEQTNRCNFYIAASDSKVCRLQGSKWVKVKGLLLVRGTFLYGEFVKETIRTRADELTYRYCLQVIDALRLGDTSLAGLDFERRREIIDVYCESVNREAQAEYSVRIRPKIVKELKNFNGKRIGVEDGNYLFYNKVLGFGAKSESYPIKSIMLLKTNENQTFHSTFVLRAQVNIKENKSNEETENITLSDLLNFIQKEV